MRSSANDPPNTVMRDHVLLWRIATLEHAQTGDMREGVNGLFGKRPAEYRDS